MWRSSFLINLQAYRLIAGNVTIKWTPSQTFFDSILSPPMLPPCIDLSPLSNFEEACTYSQTNYIFHSQIHYSLIDIILPLLLAHWLDSKTLLVPSQNLFGTKWLFNLYVTIIRRGGSLLCYKPIWKNGQSSQLILLHNSNLKND